MFYFPGYATSYLMYEATYGLRTWVPPFRNFRIAGCQAPPRNVSPPCHVFHRLLKSRHPPYALNFLLGNLKTTLPLSSAADANRFAVRWMLRAVYLLSLFCLHTAQKTLIVPSGEDTTKIKLCATGFSYQGPYAKNKKPPFGGQSETNWVTLSASERVFYYLTS